MRLECLQAKGSSSDFVAWFRPYFLEALAVGQDLFGFIDEQFGAWLILVEADQAMLPVHQDHGVAKVGEGVCGLVYMDRVTIGTQEVEKPGMFPADGLGIPESDLDAFPRGLGGDALQVSQVTAGFQLEFAQIAPVDLEAVLGEFQNPLQGRSVVGPGGQ